MTGETVGKGRGGRAPPIGLWNKLPRHVFEMFGLIYSILTRFFPLLMPLDCWLPITTLHNC